MFVSFLANSLSTTSFLWNDQSSTEQGAQDLSGALKVSQRTLRVSQGVSGAFLRLSRAVREPSEALRGFQGTLRGLSVSHEPSGSLRFFQGLSEDSQGLSGTLKDSQGLPGFLRP